jgi:hypothetical protein
MSAISGYDPRTHYLYLQSLNASQLAAQNAAASQTKPAQDSDGDSDGSTQSSSGGQGVSGGDPLFQQIQSAVTSALQSAQSSASTNNPNQVIQNAITQIFKSKQNNANGQSGQTSVSGNDPDGDGDTDTPGVADNDGSTTQSAFAQLLQSNGVNAQQFQQDFLSAVQSAQNGGSSDASSVFSTFPPGSLVDTLA